MLGCALMSNALLMLESSVTMFGFGALKLCGPIV
jgi:hypothetical protein